MMETVSTDRSGPMPHPFAGLTLLKFPVVVGRPMRRELVRALARRWRTVMLWRSRSRQRRALSKLDGRLLDDIGVDRRSARLEAEKWFWQD